jgi:uncharacterized protein YbjT (DUF2867 family)
VARHLRARNFSVRTITRDPAKPAARNLIGQSIEVLRGDFDDTASLTRALDGVYGVFSVQSPFDAGIEGEVRQGRAIADAARRSQTSYFVYSSVAGADQNTGIPHFDSKARIEQHVRNLGLNHTILRPVFFMENWLGMAGMLASGTIALPLSPGRTLQQIAVDDIGGFAALAFEKPTRWQGRAIELAGDELTMTATAELFSRLLNREIRYVQIPWEEFEQRTGHEITVMYRWFEDHGYTVDIPQLRSEYPRLTSLTRWIESQNWQAVIPGGAPARI